MRQLSKRLAPGDELGGLLLGTVGWSLRPSTFILACATRKTGLSNYCILFVDSRRLLLVATGAITGLHTVNIGGCL
jgi:hypothetical protein